MADQFAIVTAGITAGTWFEPSDYMGSGGLGSGTKRTVAMGDWIACVVEFPSFNAGDSVSPSFWDWYQIAGNYDVGTTWHAKFNGSAWAKNQTPAHIALRYDDGTYAFIAPNWWPVQTLNTTTVSSGTSPSEIGIAFQVAAPVQLAGCSFISAIGSDSQLVLYDAAGAVLATQTIIGATGFSPSINCPRWIYFNAGIPLAKNTVYRLAIKPGAVNISIYDVTVPTSAHLGGFEGGANFYRTHRTGAGAWTDTNTKRPVMGLILNGLADSGSGGGGEVSVPF